MDWFSGERETKTIVTCFDRNETSHLRIHRLSSYMGSKMRVVIAPGGGRLATDATNVGFLPSMHLQMISQIVAPGEALMTMLTLVVPCARMFCNVTLPVALNCELESTLVANKRLHTAMRTHVLL